MKPKIGLITFSFFLVLFSISAKAQTEKPADFLAINKITGAWRVNYAESDNPILKMQTILQSKLGQPTNEKEENLPTMSVSLIAPENLILAGDEDSITINEGFDEIVFTRTISTNGKQRIGELSDGARFSLKAERERNYLQIETISPRGNKMFETYALSDKGKKLIVTLRFETPEAKEIMTLRRVYDRTILDLFQNETKDFQ